MRLRGSKLSIGGYISESWIPDWRICLSKCRSVRVMSRILMTYACKIWRWIRTTSRPSPGTSASHENALGAKHRTRTPHFVVSGECTTNINDDSQRQGTYEEYQTHSIVRSQLWPDVLGRPATRIMRPEKVHAVQVRSSLERYDTCSFLRLTNITFRR